MVRRTVAVPLVAFVLAGLGVRGAFAESLPIELTGFHGGGHPGGAGGNPGHAAPPPMQRPAPRPEPPRRQPDQPRRQPEQPRRPNPAPEQPRRPHPTPEQPRRPHPTPEQPRRPHPTPEQPRRPHPTPEQPRRPHPTPEQPRRPNPTPEQPRRPRPPRPTPPQQPRRPLPPVVTPRRPGQRHDIPRPAPVPRGGLLDPRHHGWQAPRPVGAPAARPWAHGHGRQLAPGRDHVVIINTYRTNVVTIVNGWNHGDHGYYWHDWAGHRVCHHYDAFGQHWFGWYVGDVYFWTRYHNELYWWYDPYWHRWCYWRNGQWWWQDPEHAETVYVYTDRQYYRYEPTQGGVELTPDTTPPVDAPPADEEPAPDAQTKSFVSQDGSRVVEVSGSELDARLRDTGEPPAFEPVYLDSGVTAVRFKLGEDGALKSILLLKNDDSFSLFDPEGNESGDSDAPPTPQPGAAPSDQRLRDKSATFDLLNSMGAR